MEDCIVDRLRNFVYLSAMELDLLQVLFDLLLLLLLLGLLELAGAMLLLLLLVELLLLLLLLVLELLMILLRCGATAIDNTAGPMG